MPAPVTRWHQHRVVGDHVRRRYGRLDTVAAHPYRRLLQHRERVEGTFRPQLLDDAHGAVDDDHQTEEAVLWLAEHEHARKQRPDDRVEPGQHVRFHDRPPAAARPT
jgi:hypothetical protein